VLGASFPNATLDLADADDRARGVYDFVFNHVGSSRTCFPPASPPPAGHDLHPTPPPDIFQFDGRIPLFQPDAPSLIYPSSTLADSPFLPTMSLCSLGNNQVASVAQTAPGGKQCLLRVFDVSRGALVHRMPFDETVCDLVTCCPWLSRGAVAVGCNLGVLFCDPRASATPLHILASVDRGWGVRCLLPFAGLLAIAGGSGRITLADARRTQYVSAPIAPHVRTAAQDRIRLYDLVVPHRCNPSLIVDEPWGYQIKYSPPTAESRSQYEHLRLPTGTRLPQAVLGLAVSPQSDKLLAVGGPLASRLDGTYAAIWR
jgi:hypothetical protein